MSRHTRRGEPMASNGPNERQGEGRRLGGGAIASLVGVGLLVIFMIQNTEDVRLDFLVWHFTWPLWLLTIASAAAGSVGLVRIRRDPAPPSPQGPPRRPPRLIGVTDSRLVDVTATSAPRSRHQPRTMQRKPIWVVDVSTVSLCLAAGRYRRQ